MKSMIDKEIKALREAKEAEEARIAQEKLDQETKEQQKNLAYSDCLTNAQAVYENNWARNCQSIAERNKVELQNCLNTEYIMKFRMFTAVNPVDNRHILCQPGQVQFLEFIK